MVPESIIKDRAGSLGKEYGVKVELGLLRQFLFWHFLPF